MKRIMRSLGLMAVATTATLGLSTVTEVATDNGSVNGVLEAVPFVDAITPEVTGSVGFQVNEAEAAECWRAVFRDSGSSWCYGYEWPVRQKVRIYIYNPNTGERGSLDGPCKEAMGGTKSSRAIPDWWAAAWYIYATETKFC